MAHVAVVVLVAAVGACADDGTDQRTTPSEVSTGAKAAELDYRWLCSARDAAASGDADAARAAFDHGPLHVLADAVLAVDRASAAELLQAKEAVESDVADETTPVATIADDLQVLVTATADARAALGHSTTPLCEQEAP